MIVITVTVHVLGLGLVGQGVDQLLKWFGAGRAHLPVFVGVLGATVVSATLIHAMEGAIWAQAYLYLGALENSRSAMLYSISAMTSYGHAQIFLAERWQMMGALESLNGMLLFGLTTAFLYGVIRKISARLSMTATQIVERLSADLL